MSIMALIEKLSANLYYLVAVILFIIGFHTMLTHSNLIKKIMGMNIMDTSLFLFFVAIGYRRGGWRRSLKKVSWSTLTQCLPRSFSPGSSSR
jgi:multisubunit Na+/H+ antiporter MnhC subunit